MKPEFDITEVTRIFNNKGFIRERQQLHPEFTAAMRDNVQLKLLVAEVTQETIAQGCEPLTAMQTSMLFGMMLGVLLERQRTKRLII